MSNNESLARIRTATLNLLAYCKREKWAGHDPYDALNSKVFEAMPILNSRIPRLVLTQALKRSPVDIRSLLLIPKTQNSKALSLFLTSILNLSNCGLECEEDMEYLIERIRQLRSPNAAYWCWGYSFPWQTRTIVVPTATPNLVCSTFVATALLNAFEQRNDGRCLEMAMSAAEYIHNELYFEEGGDVAGFAYPLPTNRVHVHNANLLGAALLCRVSRISGDEKFLQRALKVARYSASRQQPDGSWFYGESNAARWIDNFHTGYNLSALESIDRNLNTTEFQVPIRKGFDFYRTHFFREDGAARYFHNDTYPIDIHCVAQSILTLVEFQHLDGGSVELAHQVFDWAMDNMWSDRGYFYYRVLRFMKIRTSYMRWSQAWMLTALSTLLQFHCMQQGTDSQWMSATPAVSR